jgi:hypothetical protein
MAPASTLTISSDNPSSRATTMAIAANASLISSAKGADRRSHGFGNHHRT